MVEFTDMGGGDGLQIGILGCGHLGQAIARTLIGMGFDRRNLLLSHRGSPQTREALDAYGLSTCLTDSRTLFSQARIVLLTIRPQDLPTIKETAAPEETVVASCMAGVSAELLRKVFRRTVHRMMFSGPDTLLRGCGVAAVVPENRLLGLLLSAIRVERLPVASEDDLDVFTAGVCLPAAMLFTDDTAAQRSAIGRLAAEYPLLAALYAWAETNTPRFPDGAERDAYAKRMITQGGVTEAIVNGLCAGDPLDVALRKGIARTKELAAKAVQTAAGRGEP